MCSPMAAGIRSGAARFGRTIGLPAVAQAGLAPLRFHDLRHTCAAVLVAEGAHPQELQAHLGHASITTTLNVYGHLFPNLGERLGERLDAVYRRTLAGTNGDRMGTATDPEVIELEQRRDSRSL